MTMTIYAIESRKTSTSDWSLVVSAGTFVTQGAAMARMELNQEYDAINLDPNGTFPEYRVVKFFREELPYK